MRKTIFKTNYFLRQMLHYGYMPVCGILLASLLNFAVVRGNEVISTVIDQMLAGEHIEFGRFLGEFAALTVLGFAAAFAASAVNGKYGVLVSMRCRQQVAEKLYRMEYRYFDEHNCASVINKVNADLNEAERFLNETFVMLITDAVAVLIYAGYVRRLNASLFVLVLVCYPLVLWIANRLVQKVRRLTMTYREKSDAITGIAQDALSGILIVRSFGLEEYFQEKMHAATLDLVDNEEKRARISNLAVLIKKLIQWIPNILCAVYAVVLVLEGRMSIGELMAFILVLVRLVEAFMGLPFGMVDAAGSLVSIQRVEEILQGAEESTGNAGEPIDEEIVLAFDHLTFGYSGAQTVLDNVDLEVRRGENVAFVGESGGGKSTIFHLLCGFYGAQQGEYRLYGRRFSDWDVERARAQFALVSQNVFLFPATIEENIRYGRWDASWEEIVEACRQAEIHDFIESLPMKYQTVVGERGAMLSGGQRQRIAIARAILKDAPILLLDEPTSAIDEGTEKEIQRAIARVRKGRTCLTIAHRLSTIQDADWIFEVKNRKIVEVGTYEQYLETIL
ncbi:MAG: ABC transporter ATP-binding protein/permease [Lachnospiraceae bacterium]|nr:ABC transporter ATP-binding protein/permease [Lachnospiraceae bacterium]